MNGKIYRPLEVFFRTETKGDGVDQPVISVIFESAWVMTSEQLLEIEKSSKFHSWSPKDHDYSKELLSKERKSPPTRQEIEQIMIGNGQKPGHQDISRMEVKYLRNQLDGINQALEGVSS